MDSPQTMCRIAGIISNERKQKDSCDKVAAMCRALQHGGPDDEGIFVDDGANLVFGHRRLSIIDLTQNGHQPMADIEKKAWITFNGEIYNYQVLKTELLKTGAVFHSGSDTEVILLAYLNWGVVSFSKLRGMFAFALYDVENSRTYLVRDANGIKPLYYHIQAGSISFASEVKALKTAGIATAEDADWKVNFLAFGNIPEPRTTLKDVFSLPKGSYLSWDHKNQSFFITAFLQKRTGDRLVNAQQAEAGIRHSLLSAVNRHLIADAPIGVFLSGGIDSSLLTLLAAKHKDSKLKTVSIFFDEKAYDERNFQDVVLNRITGEKFSHLVKQNDFDENFLHIMRAMDLPTTDGINSWFISKYAHEDGLKAVLSGIGADELFGGYPSFERIKYLQYLKMLPAGVFKIAGKFTRDRYKKMEFLAHHHHQADYLFLRGLFAPTDIAKILDADVSEVNSILFKQDTNIALGRYDQQMAAWFESNLYMQNQLLRDTDIMSMAHGLEVRVPFLDEDFQHTVNNILHSVRFGGLPKQLLINSFKDILPVEVWNRPKMGFSFPLQQWMKTQKNIADEDIYHGATAKKIVGKFKNDQLHWSKIFSLYQVQANG